PQLSEIKRIDPVEKGKKKKSKRKKGVQLFLIIGCVGIPIAVNGLGRNHPADQEYVLNTENTPIESASVSNTEATTESPTEPPTEEPTVAEIDPDKPMIALTYDDGPAVNLTERILDTLESYQAHATFFLVGDNITENTEKILKREVDLGCEIGNHTLSHKNLEKLDLEDAVLQLSECDDKIYQCTGTRASLVRPPYGAYNDAIREADKRMFIYWSLNTSDWKREDPDEICDIVMEYIDDGDIILMHDIHEQSVKASEKLIPALIEQGYQLVTVSELIHYRNLQTEDGMVLFNLHPDGAFFNSLYGTVCDYELQKEIFSYDDEE
ncbi:MAG: polysaccharide deacetylase family protein, partial [Oscillospiraceae bacterium]|nr:polysaccharide deacetylase family protein [Oscillospiraceae bacterium]